MLTERQEDIIADALRPLFEYLEHEVIVDVAKRILETASYSRTAEIEAQRMRELGFSPAKIRSAAMKFLRADAEYRKTVAKNTLEHKRKVKKLLREILKAAQRAGSSLAETAADLSYLDDLRVWKQAGKELTDRSFLAQFTEAVGQQTSDTMKNLTATTGFKTMSGFEASESLYRRELDKAMIKVCTGTFSPEKAVYDTVHSLAQSGLRTIDFASGYHMQLDTAVKLAVRTGAGQIAAKIMDANMERTGENLVYVSKHWGARNKGEGHANHEQWQGRVYYVRAGEDYSEEAERIGQDAITSLYHATGYSADGTLENDPEGLYGYNCRHRYYIWHLGTSELPKDDPQPEPVTINGKEYDYYAVTQKMRKMERDIRALKREREALAALKMETKEVSAKIKGKIKSYKEFCESAKIEPDINRLRYECGTSDLTKTESWKRYEEMAEAAKAGMSESSKDLTSETSKKEIEEAGRTLEKSAKSSTIKLKNSELPNGLPIKGEPNSIVDKVDDAGNILQRRKHGEDGMAIVDYDTSDHKLPYAHPTGAHKHEFDYSKKQPRRAPKPLSEQELEENKDIIQKGVNYHDEG